VQNIHTEKMADDLNQPESRSTVDKKPLEVKYVTSELGPGPGPAWTQQKQNRNRRLMLLQVSKHTN
jgi:hypothetical protein